MALINQNSIIGVTSITSPSASNVLTFHTNDTTERLRVSTSGVSFSGSNASLDTSGNATFNGNVSIGGTLTYEDVTNIDSVGVITARSDINIENATPTLNLIDTDGSTTSSLLGNSGNIYYSTSSSNRDHIFRGSSTEVARITGDGNIGIGTDNPTTKLVVQGDWVSSTGQLRIKPSSAGQTLSGFTFGTQDNTLLATNYSNSSTGNLYFQNNTESGNIIFTGPTSEHFRITSGGDVYIRKSESGASKGSAALEFYGTTSGSVDRDQAKIESSPWATNTNAGNLDFYTQTTAGNNLSLRMRINGSGNVGVGTDDPQARLSIGGLENTVVEIQPNISSGVSRILSFNRVSNAYRTLRLDGSEMKLETSSLPKLRIAANGNIGIGDDFDANNYARLSVYEDNYTYGRSLAPTSTGQYASSYSPPVGTFYYRNNTDSGAIGVRHYVQAEQGYPNAQDYLDVLIKNSGFYTIRIKASNGSSDAAVATMLVYGLANNSNTNHPVVSITGASGGGTSNPTFASGHGKGSSNAVATFWWEVLNYNVNTYDCTMRIHTTHANNQGLRAIIEECIG